MTDRDRFKCPYCWRARSYPKSYNHNTHVPPATVIVASSCGSRHSCLQPFLECWELWWRDGPGLGSGELVKCSLYLRLKGFASFQLEPAPSCQDSCVSSLLHLQFPFAIIICPKLKFVSRKSQHGKKIGVANLMNTSTVGHPGRPASQAIGIPTICSGFHWLGA